MKKFINKLYGYIRLDLEGEDICRFLNICKSKEIFAWDVSNEEERYSICVSIADFFKIKEIARKTKTKVRIKQKCGYPFEINRNKHRKAYLLGIILFFVIMYIMSLFIWDIHFVGLYTYTEDAMIEYLYSRGIKHGVLKKDIDCTSIEKTIRNDFFDITWVSVSLEGTRLTIHVRENYDYETIEETDCEMSDLIADKEGIITSIITRSGTPLVKEGDVVGKNDILVSGNVVVKDEYGTVISEKYTNADADIKAKTAYNYSDKVYITTEKQVYTGENKKSYSFGFMDKSVYLYAGKVKYANYDKTVQQFKLKLAPNFYLPIYWWQTTYNEYKVETIELSEEEAISKLDNNLQYFFDELLEKGVQIIENNVTIIKGDNYYAAEGKIIVIEELGQNVSVENLYQVEDDYEERNE
ncbi:MAG: sporulation protein YqfD [Lachnospiraceae bacterium]|nr:sporulation protein YqfD [Lachnospiraceae bacterium]